MNVAARMIPVNVRELLVLMFMGCHPRGEVSGGTHGPHNIGGLLQLSKAVHRAPSRWTAFFIGEGSVGKSEKAGSQRGG